MRRGLTALAALVGAVALLAIGAGAATTTLPGGTGFTVALSAPAAGAVLPEATPFVVSGHATIGTATPVANTYLVTAIDVSGSTDLPVSTTSCGNQNPTHDFASNTVLDCELAAGLALNNEAVNQGTVAQVGLIGFAGRDVGSFAPLANEASILDLSLAAGQQSLTAPAADSPANGTRDVNEVLASAFNQNISPTFGVSPSDSYVGFTKFTDFTSVGNTNYWAAVTQIRNLFATAPAGVTKIAVILSDGDSTVGGPSGEHVEQALAGISGIKIFTFAIGNAASCLGSGAPNYGTLQTIANATGATCTKIANPGQAADIVPDAIGSSISVPVLSDGGVTYLSPDGGLPPVFHGPGSIDFQHTYPAASATPGTHHLCARAIGSDGGGNATLVDCVDVSILAQPVVTAGGIGGALGATTEGSPFTLSGSADHGDTTWSATGGTGTCTFANASSPTTDVTCTDDGDYTITLTADDHVNAPQTASGTLHVSNVDPNAALTLSAGPHPLAQPVDASVAISDPGADTFTCQLDWGDGTSTAGAVSGNACTGSHTYAGGGLYSVSTTVTDDDGGTGSDDASVTVDTPPQIDLGGGSGGVGLSGVEGAPVALHASVTDDTAGLTLHWSATPGAGVDPGATCSFGNDASAATTITCTDDGDWQLTLTADDHVNPPVSGTIALHVANANPTLSLASVVSALTATVTGTVGDVGANDTQTCSFTWGDSSPDTTGVPVTGGTCIASHAYASGTHSSTVTVTATDDDGGSATKSVNITLNRPPSCSAVTPSVADLWPPDHTLRLIVVGGATDPDHDTLTYAITSVRQDEPTNGTGDGDTAIDAVNAGPGAVRLRAERSGNGDGRVYTITFTVSDGKGASCGGSVQVTVPKSASKPAVLSPGPGYDSYH